MKTYEVRMRWDDKQAKRMGVKYPECHLVKEIVDERTPAEAINKVVNLGYVKQNLRTA